MEKTLFKEEQLTHSEFQQVYQQYERAINKFLASVDYAFVTYRNNVQLVGDKIKKIERLIYDLQN